MGSPPNRMGFAALPTQAGHRLSADQPCSRNVPHAVGIVIFIVLAARLSVQPNEGKGASRWTRVSCRLFAANAVRLQLHALAYNRGNLLRTIATAEPIQSWSLTGLKEKLIKMRA